MKNFHALKLTASPIGSTAPRAAAEPASADEPPRAPQTGLKKRLLTLGAVELAASLGAVGAQGSIHSTIFRFAAAGLAIAVASVVAIELLAPVAGRRASATAASRPAAPRKPLTKTRILLLMVMAVGFATYFGNGGTFSSFSAEDTNANSNISSGTLTMSNVVNGFTANTCNSQAGASNVNGTCDALFALTSGGDPTQANNLAPSFYGGTAKLTLQNTGTIDATKLQVYAPSTTDCTSSQVAALGSPAWNTGNLCTNAIMYIQETGTSHHYCWYGVGVGTSTCAAPFSEAYAGAGVVASPLTWTNGSNGANGNITNGDKVNISQLNAATQTYNVVQCTAGGTVWMGDATTSLTVSGCTALSGSNSGFTSAATVTDVTTTGTTLSGSPLTTFSTDTISNFDTSHGTLAGALSLFPTTSDGNINNSGYGLGLASGGSRTFMIGVYVPTPASTNQNNLQDLKATFSLTWHSEQ